MKIKVETHSKGMIEFSVSEIQHMIENAPSYIDSDNIPKWLSMAKLKPHEIHDYLINIVHQNVDTTIVFERDSDGEIIGLEKCKEGIKFFFNTEHAIIDIQTGEGVNLEITEIDLFEEDGVTINDAAICYWFLDKKLITGTYKVVATFFPNKGEHGTIEICSEDREFNILFREFNIIFLD